MLYLKETLLVYLPNSKLFKIKLSEKNCQYQCAFLTYIYILTFSNSFKHMSVFDNVSAFQ